jgi:hypothetical protein
MNAVAGAIFSFDDDEVFCTAQLPSPPSSPLNSPRRRVRQRASSWSRYFGSRVRVSEAGSVTIEHGVGDKKE